MPIRIDEVSANVQGERPQPQTAQPEAPSGGAPAGPLAQQDELRRLWRKFEQRKARVKAD